MEFLSLNTIREKYLAFYETKGHLRLPSFSLVPQNDKSLLLINAGMAPLKAYFTGELTPPRKRVTTCQKCIRTPDIDRVGKTARHGTFFEMLGNFSFGDYFKSEAIPWAWEFLTKVMEIPEELLSVSVYLDDDEAKEIWIKTGVPAERIYKMGKEDNFWEIGSGPCGPCSEIYFDRGIAHGCGSPDCKPGCDCDRFIEIWNIVFTQFDSDGNGNYARLEHPNIDTGMGLERLACVMQDVNNLFEVDTIRNVMLKACEMSGREYTGSADEHDVSLRVITDHIRSSTFLISDGVMPSNEGRGYVLRRLIRRAARHGRLLGIKGSFLTELCETVIRESKEAYPELESKREFIKSVLSAEEERFSKTIDSGINLLEKIIDDVKAKGEKSVSGADAFKLYDTFGFPVDITKEIAEENGLSVDEDSFTALMKEQKERARSARAAQTGDAGWSDDSAALVSGLDATVFVGYEKEAIETEIVCIIADNEAVSETMGEACLVLKETPFYAESGGQVGDIGFIKTESGLFKVTDTKKVCGDKFMSVGYVAEGTISQGKCYAEIDSVRRAAIKRNHSAAHMLQAALRKVLGDHVEQSGSYVDDERVRFDFTHNKAMTAEEISTVENIVNEFILKAETITSTEMPIEEAKKTGATALFGEKYGEVVRVVKMGDYSVEFCGGTHLKNSGEAGLFKIVSESSVAAGIRRIEGITGKNIVAKLNNDENTIQKIRATLKLTGSDDVAKRCGDLSDELKAMKKEIDALKTKMALADALKSFEDAKVVGSYKICTARFDGVAVDTLRNVIDDIKARDGKAVCVFASVVGEKITFAAGCGKEAVAAGAHAGNILKQLSAITGGGGGGRPDSATSGGKDVSKLDEALAAVEKILG